MIAYDNLEKKFADISKLQQILGLLFWDTNTMMRAGSSARRGAQTAYLKTLIHDKITSPDLRKSLENAISTKHKLNTWQKANLREMGRTLDHATCTDGALIEKLEVAGNQCEIKWRSAKECNDFNLVKESLEKVFDITREIAQAKSAFFKLPAYDCLLEEYDPGRKSDEIDTIFNHLENFLPKFAQQVIDKQKGPAPDLSGHYNLDKQKELSLEIMKDLGFDFNRGRLDTSLHPFCGGSADDVRITTIFTDDQFTQSLMAIIHETGHALYEFNRPDQWAMQPVGGHLGMSIHESQSLFMEMQISRSLEFMEYLLPKLHKFFGRDKIKDPQQLFENVTHVQKSQIRMYADEVTYPLHVILRYKIEKAIIEDKERVSDLPELWNAKMKEYFNITPDNDSNGCMQDIHWYKGFVGYFPTYALGVMQAAQFAHQMAKKIDISHHIKMGKFSPIVGWLKENIHSQGALSSSSEELLQNVTGEKLNPEYFIKHLQTRYNA